MKNVLLIGYSGHAYVACDLFLSMHRHVTGYCDKEEKSVNPYGLQYFGSEDSEAGQMGLNGYDYHIAIGNNRIRKNVFEKVVVGRSFPVNAVHASAFVSKTAVLGSGIMIGAQACINAMANIGDGVICNTGSLIEHECRIGRFAHIAPGAVLCGNVEVGEETFIGASAVVIPGIKIGSNVVVGAGTVVIRDIPDGMKVAGTPHRTLK